jgi:hypothetical protein
LSTGSLIGGEKWIVDVNKVLKKGLGESRVGGSEYRSEEEFLRGLED